MIKIIQRNVQENIIIEAKGHAQSAPKGQPDLICCAVSVLFEHTAQTLERFTNEIIYKQGKDGDGQYWIMARRGNKINRLFMDALNLSLEKLAEDYPDHIVIES